jgi:hypothetical protein
MGEFMKKTNIEIALVASLLANMASANPIGRAGLDKIVREFTIKQIKDLHQVAQKPTSNPFAKSKKYAESLLLDVWHTAVQKGIIPSGKEFAELDNSFGKANHGILNLAGEGGHTLLKYALELPAYSKKELAKRRSFLKALTDRGAELNVRDIFVMGPGKELRALVNVPMNAPAKKVKKAALTLFSKNTQAKVLKRFDSFEIAQKRLHKVARAQELYPQIEKDLLAEIQEEKALKVFSEII